MTTYTQVFGGTNIFPSDVSYLSFDLAASDVRLAWPVETNAPTANADYVAARIINVNSTGAGRKIYMPEANRASVGECVLFNNIGTTTMNIVTSTDVFLASVPAGDLFQIYMTDNTTASGLWTAYQFGAGTSQASAATLAGAGLRAFGGVLNQAIIVDDINSNYTLGANERARMINWTGATGTLTLTSAVTLGDDWFCYVRNSGVSALSVTPAGGTLINGIASLTLDGSDSAMILSDGVGFYTVGLTGGSGSTGFDYTAIDIAGTGNYTLAGSELNRIAYNLYGVLTGNRALIVPTNVQQYWITNATTGAFTLTVKTAAGTGLTVAAGDAKILYCNGTNVVEGQSTGGIATPISILVGGTGATSAAGARVNLGATTTGNALFTAADGTAARTAISAPSIYDTQTFTIAMS
jgi:hypothetical protein